MTDHRQLAVDLFNHTWSLLDNKIKKDDQEWLHTNLDEISAMIDAN